MDTEDFRAHAHRLVDWMADYLADIEARPVRAQVAPGEIAARLPSAPPEAGESIEAIMDDVSRIIMPGITHWQHPSFFAYFPANASPPSVLAEMLTATMAPICMLWQTSPAATELETQVTGWLRQLFGLPEDFVGVIQDTASTSTLCALLTAREAASAFAINRRGFAAEDRLTVYCSSEAHSSVEKGVKIAGLGSASLRHIPVDAAFAMRADALDSAIREDQAAGRQPLCVVATLGTTSTSGFDPLEPIGAICRRHGIWLHVDAAWAGSALVAPEYRWMIAGVEQADSFVVNPHKWMLTNFDCTAHFVRDPDALVRTFEILPEYLKTKERDRVVDYRDWGIPLGRRFRALKLWFVIRYYGIEGLQAHIRDHVALAGELGERIAATDDFELMVPPRLALLCFRYRPADIEDAGALDEINQRLIETLNDSGALYLTQTRIGGTFAIRFAIGAQRTEARHVEEAWRRIEQTAHTLLR